jgi:hypothetical protein
VIGRRALRHAYPPLVAAISGLASWIFWSVPRSEPSDLWHLWTAARAWLRGGNPYLIPSPFAWSHHHLLYPFPAVLLTVPFALLPMRWADPVFVAIGCGALAFGLTRDRWRSGPVWVFASLAIFYVYQTSQWSPLLVAGVLFPPLGFVVAAKPTIGLALLAARPSRLAVGASGALLAISVIVYPRWPLDWWLALQTVPPVVTAPLMRLGGVGVLAAATRWRRADARLLLAMACIPHTPLLYEAVPLFLIAQTLEQGAVLAGLTVIVKLSQVAFGSFADAPEAFAMSGRLMVLCLYLPCTVMVCRRPNVREPLLT